MIWGLQVYTVDEIYNSPISQQALVSHTNVLHKSFITLVNYGGKEFLKQAPSILFNTLNFNLNVSTNVFESDIKSFVGQKVNYPKSYIEFITTPSGVANLSYLVSIYYSLPIEEEKKESGFSFGKRR
jgi:intracellular septation protein A